MKIEITQPKAVYEIGSRKNQEGNMTPAFETATMADNYFIVCDGMGGEENYRRIDDDRPAPKHQHPHDVRFRQSMGHG